MRCRCANGSSRSADSVDRSTTGEQPVERRGKAGRPMPENGAWKAGTVADVVRWLIGRKRLDALTWPPDLFAVAASVLCRSGAYPLVVERWPPGRDKVARGRWVEAASEAARRWRKTPEQVPRRLR